jgi:lysyl-tRNA synthetase class 2
MARRAPRVLTPSDLGAETLGRVHVGGRVVQAGAGTLTLADAFGLVHAEGRTLAALPGEILVLRGVYDGKRLTGASVVERATGEEPRATGDFARLAFGERGRNLRFRSVALAAVRDYFAAERFLEVATPFRVRAPGVDANVDALRAEGGFLITSPELHMKRLLVGGMPRIFEVARVSRADESGTLHEPEFTLIEWYRAFADPPAIRADTEALVARVARAISGKDRLVTPDGRSLSTRRPFPCLSVREAFRRYAGVKDASALAERDEARYFELLVGRVEPALAEFDRPVFLCDYPRSQAALARISESDPSVGERFELYAGGVELSNGYGELTDAQEQEARFIAERDRRRAEKRRVYPLDRRFLAALREGMPRASGNALGFDRLLMLATGAKSIAEVTAFPARDAF